MASPVQYQIDDRDFQKALIRFYASQRKSWPEVIRSQARLVAVNLAIQTQPFGDSSTGKSQGEGAIRRDLNYIFKPLNERSMAFFREVLGGRQVRLQLKRKDGSVWITDLDEYLSRGRMKYFHQGQRTAGRGNVKNANKKNVTRDIGRHDAHPRGIVSQADFQSYIAKTIKKVGIAKAGWAACAKQLRGSKDTRSRARGVPGWVTRHIDKRAKGDVSDMTAGKNPYVEMTNLVPWIDKCLSPGQMQRALDIQREKMIKATEYAMAADARKAGF